jgi:hypothetical protein
MRYFLFSPQNEKQKENETNTVSHKRQYPNKNKVFVEDDSVLGNNAPAVKSQQRKFG